MLVELVSRSRIRILKKAIFAIFLANRPVLIYCTHEFIDIQLFALQILCYITSESILPPTSINVHNTEKIIK
jgi:hypothetical protein